MVAETTGTEKQDGAQDTPDMRDGCGNASFQIIAGRL